MEIQFIDCPDANFRRGRPFGLRPEAIVVHIMDGSFAAGESVFRNPSSQKSAHYGISKAGEIHQYVDEHDTAFHAGIVVNPTWSLLKPRVNPNFYTIGIEHEGRPDDVWPETQLSASAELIGEIATRWKIPLDESHVIRHHQIRASKTCPGNWLKMGELLTRVPARQPLTIAATAGVSTGTDGSIGMAAGATVAAPVIPPAPVSGVHLVGPVPITAKTGVVRTVKNVNLRRGRPSTAAPILRTIPAQTEVPVSGFEIGEAVIGNPNWYVDLQGNFFWAGATDVPDPRP